MASEFRLAYEAQRLRPPDPDDADAGGCCGSATIVNVAFVVDVLVATFVVVVVTVVVVEEVVEFITGIFF